MPRPHLLPVSWLMCQCVQCVYEVPRTRKSLCDRSFTASLEQPASPPMQFWTYSHRVPPVAEGSSVFLRIAVSSDCSFKSAVWITFTLQYIAVQAMAAVTAALWHQVWPRHWYIIYVYDLEYDNCNALCHRESHTAKMHMTHHNVTLNCEFLFSTSLLCNLVPLKIWLWNSGVTLTFWGPNQVDGTRRFTIYDFATNERTFSL